MKNRLIGVVLIAAFAVLLTLLIYNWPQILSSKTLLITAFVWLGLSIPLAVADYLYRRRMPETPELRFEIPKTETEKNDNELLDKRVS
jgi:hypothetical protein